MLIIYNLLLNPLKYITFIIDSFISINKLFFSKKLNIIKEKYRYYFPFFVSYLLQIFLKVKIFQVYPVIVI